MKLIKSKLHGFIDYLLVIFLILSPSLFQLTHFVATITYALAGVHLVLTLLTDFPYGPIKLVPYKIHGLIEFIVSIVLIALPWILHFDADGNDRHFYIILGGTIFLTWLLTDYQHKEV